MLLRFLISNKKIMQTKDIKPLNSQNPLLFSKFWTRANLILIPLIPVVLALLTALLSLPPTNSWRPTKTRCEKRWDTDVSINSFLCYSDCLAMHAPTHVECTVQSEKSRVHGTDIVQALEMELKMQVIDLGCPFRWCGSRNGVGLLVRRYGNVF